MLDFPYVYKLDGNKLYCNAPSSNNPSGCCEGVIDYDPGFNHLFCTKCGVRYKAKELEKAIKDDKVIVKSEGEHRMKVTVKGGSKNVAKEVTTGEYADLAKKTPSKPVLGRDTMKSNTQVKAEQKKTDDEKISVNTDNKEVKVEKEIEVKDARREVICPITIDPDFKSIDKKFEELSEEVLTKSLSNDQRKNIVKIVSKLCESFVPKKEEPVVETKEVSLEDLLESAISNNDTEKISSLLDTLLSKFMDSKVNFNDLYYDEEENQIVYAVEFAFVSKSDETNVWSDSIDLRIDPIALLNPIYEAGYKLNSDDEKSVVEFTSGEEFSGDFDYFAAKVINVNEINKDLQPNKVLTLVNEDGEYVSLNGNIVAIDMIDDRSVQSIAIVSKHWLDNMMEEKGGTEKELDEDLNVALPTGIVPPANSEFEDDVVEKFVNGVPIV